MSDKEKKLTTDLSLYAKTPEETQDPYLDEIHRAASEKNYKALLQGDIAAYNLHANTKKYLDNALAEQGLGTQGYGTSAHIGAGNQAQNLYAQNLEAYNQNEQDALLAAQDRQAAAANENDNQLVTFLQYSDGSEDAINGYMANYGYKPDGKGGWVNANGQAPSAYVLSAIQSAQENGNASGDAASYNSLESLLSGTYVKDNGSVGNLNDNFNSEVNLVWSRASNGEYKAGDVIKIRNGQGEVIYLRYDGRSNLSRATKEEYDKASSKGQGKFVSWSDGKTYEGDEDEVYKNISDEDMQNMLRIWYAGSNRGGKPYEGATVKFNDIVYVYRNGRWEKK